MMKALSKKYKSARDFLSYRWAMLQRPKANASIAHISEQTPSGHPGAILCEGLWDHPHHWLRLSMFRRAAAKTFGSDLIGLYEQTAAPNVIASLRALGLNGEEVIPSTVSDKCRDKAASMLDGIHTSREIFSLDFPDGYPAHYFHDGVLKAEKIGQLDFSSTHLDEHLAKTLSYLEFYKAVFERHDIRALVVSHPTTIRFSTLVWTALNKGVPVFVLNYVNKHITIRRLDRTEEFTTWPNDLPTIEDRDNLSAESRSQLIDLGDKFLAASLTGKEGQISMVNVYGNGNQAFASRQAFCKTIGADPSKPINVVMANCWPDFPNAYGPSYYTDYVDWFRITLKAIGNDNTCTWILKPHPAEHLYGEKTTMKKLLDFPLPKDVYLWPQAASGIEIHSFADTVLTAIGTSGIEFPALGVRVLAAKETPYTSWGFANFVDSKDAYTKALQTISQLPKPSDRAQEDAKIFLALTNADLPETSGLQLPWGLISYRLWPTLPIFIHDNQTQIEHEIDCIENWLNTQARSYHVSRMLMLSANGQGCNSKS